MALTGVDPNDPRPSARRELVFAAGPSSGGSNPMFVLIYGNKTSAGSETVNVIGTPVLNDADAIARFGRRSEWYWLYKKFVAVDPAAIIYGVAVPEGGGATAAAADFTFATTATAVSTVEITCLGEKVEATVAVGDTPTTIAAAVVAAINAASEGGWPITAGNVAGVVTVTAANLGPRGDLIVGNASDRGVRMRFTKSATTTVTKGALTAGTVDDDFTTAYAQAAAGEFYYQVSPKHSTSTVTSTDNGIGEHIDMIKTQALPTNGKGQTVYFGLVGTQAQATAVAISSAANSVRAFFFHAEDNDWTPGMLAAHHAGAVRSKQIAYPAANLNGYASTDSQVYQILAPYNIDDRPTSTEEILDLNNGVCPVAFTPKGSPYLSRLITSRSLNAQGNNDYRAREGHVTRCMDFFWETALARWNTQKQPNIADDPPAGQKPLPLTSTPSSLKSLLFTVVDDLAGPTPLGTYPGPILASDRVAQMKASTVVTRSGNSLVASMDVHVVSHLIKMELTANQVDNAS